MKELKSRQFFFGCVTAGFFPYETYGLDEESSNLQKRLDAELKAAKKNVKSVYAICELMIYTKTMSFSWKKDTPEEYKTIETWWNMTQNEESLVDSFLFWRDNVPGQLLTQFWDAKLSAHTIWKPSDEKSEGDQSDEEKADPNSQSDNEQSGKK